MKYCRIATRNKRFNAKNSVMSKKSRNHRSKRNTNITLQVHLTLKTSVTQKQFWLFLSIFRHRRELGEGRFFNRLQHYSGFQEFMTLITLFAASDVPPPLTPNHALSYFHSRWRGDLCAGLCVCEFVFVCFCACMYVRQCVYVDMCVYVDGCVCVCACVYAGTRMVRGTSGYVKGMQGEGVEPTNNTLNSYRNPWVKRNVRIM